MCTRLDESTQRRVRLEFSYVGTLRVSSLDIVLT